MTKLDGLMPWRDANRANGKKREERDNSFVSTIYTEGGRKKNQFAQTRRNNCRNRYLRLHLDLQIVKDVPLWMFLRGTPRGRPRLESPEGMSLSSVEKDDMQKEENKGNRRTRSVETLARSGNTRNTLFHDIGRNIST